MDSMTLFIASLAVSCIGALASVLLIRADNAAKTAGCLIGAAAAALSFIGVSRPCWAMFTSVDTIFFFPFAHFRAAAQSACPVCSWRSSRCSRLPASIYGLQLL